MKDTLKDNGMSIMKGIDGYKNEIKSDYKKQK